MSIEENQNFESISAGLEQKEMSSDLHKWIESLTDLSRSLDKIRISSVSNHLLATSTDTTDTLIEPSYCPAKLQTELEELLTFGNNEQVKSQQLWARNQLILKLNQAVNQDVVLPLLGKIKTYELNARELLKKIKEAEQHLSEENSTIMEETKSDDSISNESPVRSQHSEEMVAQVFKESEVDQTTEEEEEEEITSIGQLKENFLPAPLTDTDTPTTTTDSCIFTIPSPPSNFANDIEETFKTFIANNNAPNISDISFSPLIQSPTSPRLINSSKSTSSNKVDSTNQMVNAIVNKVEEVLGKSTSDPQSLVRFPFTAPQQNDEEEKGLKAAGSETFIPSQEDISITDNKNIAELDTSILSSPTIKMEEITNDKVENVSVSDSKVKLISSVDYQNSMQKSNTTIVETKKSVHFQEEGTSTSMIASVSTTSTQLSQSPEGKEFLHNLLGRIQNMETSLEKFKKKRTEEISDLRSTISKEEARYEYAIGTFQEQVADFKKLIEEFEANF